MRTKYTFSELMEMSAVAAKNPIQFGKRYITKDVLKRAKFEAVGRYNDGVDVDLQLDPGIQYSILHFGLEMEYDWKEMLRYSFYDIGNEWSEPEIKYADKWVEFVLDIVWLEWDDDQLKKMAKAEGIVGRDFDEQLKEFYANWNKFEKMSKADLAKYDKSISKEFFKDMANALVKGDDCFSSLIEELTEYAIAEAEEAIAYNKGLAAIERMRQEGMDVSAWDNY